MRHDLYHVRALSPDREKGHILAALQSEIYEL